MDIKRERRDDGDGARDRRRGAKHKPRVHGNEEEREHGLIGRLKRYGTRMNKQ